MKVPILLALGLCLSLSMPSFAQRPGGQQQQHQQQDKKQTKQKRQDRTHQQTQQQTQPQTQQQERQRTQQQERQEPRSHSRPQVRQQEQQRTQQQTQPQVRQQERQRSEQQMREQNRERFTPARGPERRTQRNAPPQYYRHPDGRIDRTPRYHNGIWYGRAAPNDMRFRLRQPYRYGHFYRVGPSYYHRIVRFNRAHYWFWLSSGYYFQIAYWDWPYCADWCWSCGDQFLIYLDPDHPGWYLVLNVQTGVYVHAIFMGR